MTDKNIRVELSVLTGNNLEWTWYTDMGTKTDQGETVDGSHKEWTKTQLNNQNVKKTSVTTQHRS